LIGDKDVVVPKSVMNTSQVNGLYPIIRRVRRPLLPTDAADAKPPEPVKPEHKVVDGAAELPAKEGGAAAENCDERS
jgi:hypothetical protein